MKSLRMLIETRAKPDDGASAVEYALLAAAIAAVIVVVIFAIGRIVNEEFDDTCTAIDGQAVNIAASCTA